MNRIDRDLDAAPVRTDSELNWQRQFLTAWLCSAVLVTIVRLLHAADLRYDFTLQIQAARNLLAGNGLTIYSPTAEDLADPLSLVTLTWFPSGYSLAAAGLMALGATPSTVLKVLGSCATLLGWWGWARLALGFMDAGVSQHRVWRWAALGVAVVTPLLFTVHWGGTDIFLWAAVPWVLILVTRPSRAGIRSEAIAGAIVGVAILMRYASVFLAGYAFLILVVRSALEKRRPVARTAAFGLGAAPALLLQLYINAVLSDRPVTPGGLNLDQATGGIAEQIWNRFWHVTTANLSAFFWLPPRILNAALAETPLGMFSLSVLGILFVLVAIAAARDPGMRGWRVTAPASAGMLVGLPAFLLLCEGFGAYGYAREPRYYWPLIPLSVLLTFFLSTTPALGRGRLQLLCRGLARAYVLAFLLVSTAQVARMLVPGEVGVGQRAKALGTREFRGWPSFGPTYDSSPTRHYVYGLMKERPDAILITNAASWFFGDSDADITKRLSPIRLCDELEANRVTGPARLLVLGSDDGDVQDVYWFGAQGERRHAECLERLGPFTLLREFPDEYLKVLERVVPAGVRIQLKPSLHDSEQ